MNNKGYFLSNILPASFLSLVSFILFFLLGLKLNNIIFFGVLGKPEDMGWLLFTFSSIFFGLIFGVIGSLLAIIIYGLWIKAKLPKLQSKRFLLLKVCFCAYALSLLWILLVIIALGIIIPPCPNCYK